ncbi:hypothetical protein AVEN_142383-1 [Araneus ventricosus]|uniref:Uncharacterized protein n=1 Tax=Araneus ventricosus TaxID=182803 RepID=A0A4Y2PEV5_ARAVE|nr:hypothetical protein AVEN_142383-1 [Araneus ventricosus]
MRRLGVAPNLRPVWVFTKKSTCWAKNRAFCNGAEITLAPFTYEFRFGNQLQEDSQQINESREEFVTINNGSQTQDRFEGKNGSLPIRNRRFRKKMLTEMDPFQDFGKTYPKITGGAVFPSTFSYPYTIRHITY